MFINKGLLLSLCGLAYLTVCKCSPF